MVKIDFISHDDKTIHEMLEAIGIDKIEELFEDIPRELLIKELKLPSGLSEPELVNKLSNLAQKNRIYANSFLGAGCYFHYIPSTVDFIISRSEFYTSYTPYQAEASQGLLQAMYEYQTIIAKLTQMDVVNASMYDGSTALAEAILMATIITKKNSILLLKGVHPEYIEVVKTYCWAQNVALKIITEEEIQKYSNKEVAAFIFQSPNFFGDIENVSFLVKKVKETLPECLIIQAMTDPTCLGVLQPPGETDIDIFVAEGQPFGISPTFGGPGLGIFATKQEYLRKTPGRLVGKTKELNGTNEGFILTLQAREQHIRREKASSNICTNQALCALSALIYLLSMGHTGLREIAAQNIQKAHYAKSKLALIPEYELLNNKPIYNEFLVKCPNIDNFIEHCEHLDLLPPLKLEKYYPEMTNVALICVTEMNSGESIEKLLLAAQKANQNV